MYVGGAARRTFKTAPSFYVAISSSKLSLTDCSFEYKKTTRRVNEEGTKKSGAVFALRH